MSTIWPLTNTSLPIAFSLEPALLPLSVLLFAWRWTLVLLAPLAS